MHLAPRTELYESDSSFVLRTADDEHFALSLGCDEFDELAAALSSNTPPESDRPRAALSALIAAGHVSVDDSVEAISVEGSGRLASALTGLLTRTGSSLLPPGESTRSIAVSDDEAETLTPGGHISCFRDGNLSVIVPDGVQLTDVRARRAASSLHRRRIEDGYAPVPQGRRLSSPVHPMSVASAEFVAAQVMAEMFFPTAAPHRVTAIDLRTLRLSCHPVLPMPEPPR